MHMPSSSHLSGRQVQGSMSHLTEPFVVWKGTAVPTGPALGGGHRQMVDGPGWRGTSGEGALLSGRAGKSPFPAFLCLHVGRPLG